MPGPAPRQGKSDHGQMSEPVIEARALPGRCGASRRDAHADFSAVPKASITLGMTGGPLGCRPLKPPVLGRLYSDTRPSRSEATFSKLLLERQILCTPHHHLAQSTLADLNK